MDITPRSVWGARPPKETPVKVTWAPGGTLWLHHTVGDRVSPLAPGMPGPKWLKVLKAPAKYPADLVRKIRMQKALAEASRQKTIEAECAAMRHIQGFHMDTRGWNDIGYAYVCFTSGRVYEGRGWGVLAAHCPGHNEEPSISLAGDYTKTPPSLNQRLAVDRMLKFTASRTLKGHRDGFPTSCPGDAAYHAFGLDK